MEAYRVGIVIALSNNASSILRTIASDLNRTDAAAVRLKNTLRDIKLLGLAGAGLGIAGALGLDALKDTLKPAREYAHQLNIMNMAGLKQAEIADAIGAAWKTTGDIVTTTATGNLKALMDMRNVLTGGMPEAIQMLPITSKIAAVMAASSETSLKNNADNIAFSVAKAMDIMGLNTADAMEHGAARMSQVIAAFQNRVSPEAIATTTYYARQSRYDMDDFMRWGVVPSMMLERAGGQGGQGGGSRGIGPSLAAVNRMAVVGTMSKKTAEWWASLDLLGEGRIRDIEHPARRGSRTLPTATTMTQTMGLKDQEGWSRNAFLATWRDLVPALQKKFGDNIVDDPAKMRAILASSGMSQMAMSQLMEWVTKPGNVLRDAANVGVMPDLKDLPPALREVAKKLGLDPHRGAMPYDEAYKAALKNDPELAFRAAEAQWTNLKTVIGNELIPIVIPALHWLADTLNELAQWGKANPGMLRDLVVGFAALSATLAFAGVVLTLTAAFKALKLVLYDLPAAIGAARAGAAAGGAAGGAAPGGLAAAGALGGKIGSLLTMTGTVGVGLWVLHKMNELDADMKTLPDRIKAAKDSGMTPTGYGPIHEWLRGLHLANPAVKLPDGTWVVGSAQAQKAAGPDAETQGPWQWSDVPFSAAWFGKLFGMLNPVSAAKADEMPGGIAALARQTELTRKAGMTAPAATGLARKAGMAPPAVTPAEAATARAGTGLDPTVLKGLATDLAGLAAAAGQTELTRKAGMTAPAATGLAREAGMAPPAEAATARAGTGLDPTVLKGLATDLAGLAAAAGVADNKTKTVRGDLDALGLSLGSADAKARGAIGALDGFTAAIGRLQAVVMGSKAASGGGAPLPAIPGMAGRQSRSETGHAEVVAAIDRLGSRLPAKVVMDGRTVASLVGNRLDREAARWPSDRDQFDDGQMPPAAGSGAVYTA